MQVEPPETPSDCKVPKKQTVGISQAIEGVESTPCLGLVKTAYLGYLSHFRCLWQPSQILVGRRSTINPSTQPVAQIF